MKILLMSFSGTGNTTLCGEFLKNHFEECGHQVDHYQIKESNSFDYDINDYDLVGFGYPIHAFNAPSNVNKFVKRIKKVEEKKPAFVLMVSGEYMTLNHSSDNKMKRILNRRNILIDSEYHYIMPYNMIFRHTEKRAYQMYKTMNALSELDVKDYLIDNKCHKLAKHKGVGWLIWMFRIEQPFAPVNGKTFKINKKKCVKCMQCVKNCPTHNIEFKDGKFKFHNHCLCCTRCSFNCPTNAFSIGLLTGWKVNGKYKFQEPTIEEVDKHPKYCKKSYIRYYKEADERLSQRIDS